MKQIQRDKPHRRRNLLTGEWILVSPHRTQRPWQGHEGDVHKPVPEYDAGCYLCPGNGRAGGASNPDYDGVFIFDNDYPALLADVEPARDDNPLMAAESVRGRCRVICYGPRHDQPLHHMPAEQVEDVIRAWMAASAELASDHEWVQIFENRGSLMGASSPHPHGQIWAINALPTEAARELDTQRDYFDKHGSHLLVDYLGAELAAGERVVHETEHWVAVVPYWATWPYESLLLPRRNVARLEDLEQVESASLANFLKDVFNKYDHLFEAPMSYSFGWHSAPASADDSWQLHAHVYPPALRSATVPKFMVGFELLAEKQRDITAELAAERLRDLPVEPLTG